MSRRVTAPVAGVVGKWGVSSGEVGNPLRDLTLALLAALVTGPFLPLGPPSANLPAPLCTYAKYREDLAASAYWVVDNDPKHRDGPHAVNTTQLLLLLLL